MNQSVREQQLLTAIKLTCGDRNETHGDPVFQHRTAGQLQAALHEALSGNPMFRELSHLERAPLLAVLGQICIKLSRFANGDIFHEDTTVDGAAYFAILGEVADTIRNRRPEANMPHPGMVSKGPIR